MIITRRAYPRVGLIGNPSDGYFGRTISFTFQNFWAEVLLYESPELHILPSERDHSVFTDMVHLVEDVRDFGYYGGIRLLKAAVKTFYEYCVSNDIRLPGKNFTLRYTSNIPHLVGLGGSSAIIKACMDAMMAFYDVRIPEQVYPNLVLSVEKKELNISAGLQDRVAQVYGGLVYMDFNRELMETEGHGIYERLDPGLLPKLYVAYVRNRKIGSEVFHNNIRERFDRGEKEVVDAMKFWAQITDRFRECLIKKKKKELPELLNMNFDRRRTLYKLSQRDIDMVEGARSVGASAKYTGSGGAVVGTYANNTMYRDLQKTVERIGDIELLKPEIV